MMRRLGISSIALAPVVLAPPRWRGPGSRQRFDPRSILDASGAALPGATVTATHLSTGVETVRQATGAGVYTVSPLAPGELPRHGRAPGLPDVRPGVGHRGRPRRRRPQRDAEGRRHHPGGDRVGDVRRCCATADGRLGQTIRNEVYTALPLVMNTGGPRDPTAFMFLMPGVQSVGRWGNVMGGQDFTNETYVEGVPITNAVVQGEGRNLSFGISVEAIDQFQVETSGTAVMYNGQGVSNYVVKSGTNQFRGSAFEFFRNKALDSKAFFAAAKPDDNQHEFGFTLGGPLRRNQAFFFLRRLPRSAADRVPADLDPDGGAAQRRLQRAAGGHLRSGDDAAQPERHRIRPRSFPATSSPPAASRRSRATCSRSCPPLERQPAEQLPRRPPAGRVQQRQHHDQGRPAAVVAAPGRGAVRARQAQPGDAVPRRRQRPDAAPPLATEHTLVEEIPTTAQVKHTYVMGRRWVNQASLGFARLSVPIFNATIDGRYPIEAGITGLPTGEADASFPEIAGPNAPTNWRTDARAFTSIARTATFQNNLQWTAGRTRDVRLPGAAHGCQRARAHLRQPGDVRVQQLADGRLHRHRHAQRSDRPSLRQLPARRAERDERHRGLGGGDQRPFPHLRLLGAGRLQGQRATGQPRPALRQPPYRGLRSLVVHEPGPAEPAVGGYRARSSSPLRRQQLRGRDADRDLLRGPRPAPRRRLQPERPHGAARLLRDHVFAARRRRRPGRRAQRHRHARLLGQRRLRVRTGSRRPTGTTASRRIRLRRSSTRRSTPASSPDAATAAASTYGDPEIGGRPPRYQNWNIGTQYA